jgi:hypothetical protein
MNVAIVGSRPPDPKKVTAEQLADYQAMLEEVRKVVRGLPLVYPGRLIVIVSGGARGVDETAEDEANKNGMPVVSYRPDWNGPLGKGAGFARNQLIVDQAEIVFAFWDGRSRGTLDTVDKARAAGITARVGQYVHGKGMIWDLPAEHLIRVHGGKA